MKDKKFQLFLCVGEKRGYLRHSRPPSNCAYVAVLCVPRGNKGYGLGIKCTFDTNNTK